MNLYSMSAFVSMLCYALGSVGTFCGVPGGRRPILNLCRMFTWAGFAIHTLIIVGIVLTHGPDELSKGYFVQLLAWSILLIYFIGWRWLKSSFLSMTAAPLALLLFILSFKLSPAGGHLPSKLMELFFALHIGPMFVSLGLLTMAFGAALLFLRMERKIKSKLRFSEFDQELPALDAFDRVNHKCVLFGFPLYTLGIAAGFVWAPLTWGNEVSWSAEAWDPKEIVSLLVWFLYAVLFHMRLIKNWRGRKAALMAILIFAVSVFSLVVVNFCLSTHHSFNLTA